MSQDCYTCKHYTQKEDQWYTKWCSKFDKQTGICDCPSDHCCRCGPQALESDCWEESDESIRNRTFRNNFDKYQQLEKDLKNNAQNIRILTYAGIAMKEEYNKLKVILKR